eukprot:MONOS_2439.1-p1 / transcript=MONOS_2439.1 / gene=MONOS_2439 / organism=Monocercomonoides_exilis_PA203 / gene_product=unspecified product / transcript_product=unspecified product / location=Mono_scaffold00050:116942-117782(-) / protein_length=205 / sequence_SO=supercontig / SO=protein_coding / is_pseudo=false
MNCLICWFCLFFVHCGNINDYKTEELIREEDDPYTAGGLFTLRYNFAHKVGPYGKNKLICQTTDCVAQAVFSDTQCICLGDLSTEKISFFDNREGFTYQYSEKRSFVWSVECSHDLVSNVSMDVDNDIYRINVLTKGPVGCKGHVDPGNGKNETNITITTTPNLSGGVIAVIIIVVVLFIGGVIGVGVFLFIRFKKRAKYDALK